MRIRKVSAVASAAVIALVTAGCSTSEDDSVPLAQSPVDSSISEMCERLNPTIKALHDPAGTGVQGGYVEARDLNSGLSLYDTAWKMAIADELNVSVRLSNRSGVESGLLVASQFLSGEGSPDGPPLQVLRLAEYIQDQSGINVIDVGSELEKFRATEGFGWTHESESTPASTLLAAQIAHRSDIEVSNASVLIESTLEKAREFSADADVETLLEKYIPLMATLRYTLSPEQFSERVQDASELATRWQSTLADGPAGAIRLSGLYWLDELDSAGYIKIPALPSSFRQGLVPGESYYTVDGTNPDPQTTFYAVRLGFQVPSGLEETLRRTLTPSGWLDTTPTPTLDATYYASMIHDACGGNPIPAPALVEQALNASASEANFRSMLLACSLAALQEDSAPKQEPDRWVEALDKAVATAELDRSNRAYLKAIEGQCGIAAKVAPPSNEAIDEDKSILDVYASSATPSSESEATAEKFRERLSEFRVSDTSTYALDTQSTEANLVATSMAADILGLNETVRDEVASEFRCGAHYGMVTQGTEECVGVTLAAQYAAMALITEADEIGLISFVPEG